MVLINMVRKCLWARHIPRFICKIIQSLPTNDRGRGWKMMRARRGSPTCIRAPSTQRIGGPTCHGDAVIALWALSSPRLALLSFPIRRRSAAKTMLVLMKPSDEVAITDFCHCHQGQSWRRRWREGGAGGGYLTPEGFSTPAALRWMAGWLSCCQRQLESASWIRGLLYEWLLEVKWCIAAYGDVSGLTDDPVTPPCTLKKWSSASMRGKGNHPTSSVTLFVDFLQTSWIP